MLLLSLQVTVGDDEDAPLLKLSDPANNAIQLSLHNAYVYAALYCCAWWQPWTHRLQLLVVSIYWV